MFRISCSFCSQKIAEICIVVVSYPTCQYYRKKKKIVKCFYVFMLKSICKRFNVDRSTALYITRRIVKAFVELAPTIVKWLTGAWVDEVWAEFENTSGRNFENHWCCRWNSYKHSSPKKVGCTSSSNPMNYNGCFSLGLLGDIHRYTVSDVTGQMSMHMLKSRFGLLVHM